MLLVGAGPAAAQLRQRSRESRPGFNAENLLVVNLPLSPLNYRDNVDADGRRRAHRLDRIRALPGVRSAAMTTTLPMAGAGATIHFNRAALSAEGPDDYVMAGFRAATPDYLSTLGVPLRRGRLLVASRTAKARLRSS